MIARTLIRWIASAAAMGMLSAGKSLVTLVIATTVQSTAVTNACANPGPTDPVAAARCLATGQCSGPVQPTGQAVEARQQTPPVPGLERAPEPGDRPQTAQAVPPPPVCAAVPGLRDLPADLREQLLALERTNEASVCAQAVHVLAPLREEMRSAYESAPPESLQRNYVSAATDYVNSCFTSDMLLDRGSLYPPEVAFLRAHVGFILLRHNLSWADSQPICHAVRLGRIIITAQHCIPMNSAAFKAGSGYTPEIGFRFLDQPTTYGLVLRKLGTAKGFVEERHLDYAILQITGSPELNEDIAPLVGKMELFHDFITLTANVYLRIASNIHSGTALEFRRATRVEHSVLCRPAYIAPNGLFLHACHTESGISGAPMFQRRGGRLVFVGIHNGVTESLDDPSLAGCAAGISNYGVVIPPAVLTELGIR